MDVLQFSITSRREKKQLKKIRQSSRDTVGRGGKEMGSTAQFLGSKTAREEAKLPTCSLTFN